MSNGAKKDYQGNLIVPEHVDKVKVRDWEIRRPHVQGCAMS